MRGRKCKAEREKVNNREAGEERGKRGGSQERERKRAARETALGRNMCRVNKASTYGNARTGPRNADARVHAPVGRRGRRGAGKHASRFSGGEGITNMFPPTSVR